MRTKVSLFVICVILAISNIITYVSLQNVEQGKKTPSDYTDFQIYETEFEDIPYLVFVLEGRVVGVVHNPKDYME